MKKTPSLTIKPFYLAALYLGFLALLFFHAVLLGGEAFYLVDISTLEIPNHLWMKAHLGELWNAFLVTGQPHFANSQTYTFDFIHALSLLFPPLFGFHFYVVSHFWVAGVGFWLLLKKWRFTDGTALFGAIVFTYGGFFISLGHLVLILNVVTFVPWALWSHSHMLEAPQWQGRFFWTAITALILMLGWFGGDPHFVMMSILILALLPWALQSGEPLRANAWLLAALLWSALLAAVQLVPFFEFLSHSNRKEVLSFADVTRWSFEPRTLLSFLFPHDIMDLNAKQAWGFGYWEKNMPYIWSIHLGIVSFAAAVFAVFAKETRRQYRWLILFGGSLTVVGIFLALGRYNPLYHLLYTALPPLRNFRFPEKFLFLAHFGLVILGCLGVENLSQRHWLKAKNLQRLAVIFIGLALLWMAVGPGLLQDLSEDGFWKFFLPTKLLVLCGGLVLLCGILGFTKPGRTRIYLLLALVSTELWLAHRHLNATLPQSVYETSEPVLWAQAQGLPKLPYRLMTMPIGNKLGGLDRTTDLPAYYREIIGTLQPQMGIAFDLADINSSNSLHLDTLEDFRTLFEKDRLKTLQLFSIRYIWSPYAIDFKGLKLVKAFENPPQTYVYEYADALPKAYLISDWLTLSTDENLFQALLEKDFDPKNKALISGDNLPPEPSAKTGINSGHITQWQQYGDEISLSVETQKKVLLVLTESFYPGWKAFIDDQATPIFKANGFFQGVFVEPGKHEVLFSYRPQSLALGFGISLASGFVLLLGLSLSFYYGGTRPEQLKDPQPGKRRERTKKKKSRPTKKLG